MKSVYIHIPFCNSICSYCDFSKIFYNKDIVDKYLKELEKEIKTNYKNEIIKTIYIGGGTPTSLNIEQLNQLFSILKIFKKDKNIEFTIECNIESLTKEKLILFKENNINRLSIGIETFNPNLLKYLNRSHTKEQVFDIIKYAKEIGFNNINIDLIYGLKNQTLEDLKEDLDLFLQLEINHISTYSLIIEPHTKLYLKNEDNIDEELDYEMYNYICETLNKNNFKHYEVSNFAKEKYESKHNLVYWNNEEYYGFGLGAGGYINNIRYTNTRSMNHYLEGKYLLEEDKLTKLEEMQNEMILGLRKMEGVNINKFKEKFNQNIEDTFEIKKLLEEEKLIKKDNFIFINPKYIYLSNEILINFIGD